ncbi:hypothetical protein TNCV_2142221 [Trichonephila clavipes]|uniref:Integrase catalytic domain-containing protein n=1 Tax=Trichonephila clavipes TaxID=2585209 RepID=A0A8X6VC82_TRICX|nr:hypothetical protein TNCV_2142221 [Trichonephila clavipes]
MQISAENLQEELDLRHVENRQIKKELEKLILHYKPVKTASTDVTMRIVLKDEEPFCQPPRRLAFTERQEVNKQIEEWLNEGIIRTSSSEYASPIVIVKNKNGSSRMCIDYRKLNQKLVKDKYPLPLIEDVLDTLQEAKKRKPLCFFGTQQKEAFEKLKKILSEGPILHLYKYGRKTELHTDACKQGYGAILLQEAEDGKLHPVYYMSKKTNTAEKKDYAKKELITRIARWALQLEEFDYEIEHRAGSRMKHVDALSRYPVMMESIPLSTYHVDFIGPLPSTNKSYQHIFTVVDAFTKFTWLYPVKTVSAESALEKLKQQQKTFGNPIRIISDRDSAFTSKLFNDYCDKENIQHLQIATRVPRGNGLRPRVAEQCDVNINSLTPRGNGQVERIHRTLIPVLTKLSLDDSTKWYKYVDILQRILNSTICRSTKWRPFELLVGTKMRNKEDILIKDLLLEEMVKELLEQRQFLRNDAKKNIETLQSENRKTYNRRRKKASLYKERDLVAIQRTQFGAGLKLRPNF